MLYFSNSPPLMPPVISWLLTTSNSSGLPCLLHCLEGNSSNHLCFTQQTLLHLTQRVQFPVAAASIQKQNSFIGLHAYFKSKSVKQNKLQSSLEELKLFFPVLQTNTTMMILTDGTQSLDISLQNTKCKPIPYFK